MRIVQFANFYTSRSGGLRTCVDEVGRRYGELGHQRVLVVPGGRDLDQQTPAGRRIAVRGPVLPGTGGYRVVVARRRVLGLLEELRPDILEVNDKISLGWLSPWAQARGIPLLLFSHERTDAALAAATPGWLPTAPAAAWSTRRIEQLVRRVVVGSRYAAAEFDRSPGLDTRIVPLGVDLETFRPTLLPRPRSRRAAQLVLVGRLAREKQPEHAVAALRVLVDRRVPVGLLVIGDGPRRRALERAATGLPVRFLGHVPDRRSIAHLVAAADVLIAPGPVETFGLAVLESLACGTPVVVPAAGATPELVAGSGCGEVCDSTPTGLADGVLRMLDRPAAERRDAARARAENYPWSATVAGLLAAHTAAGSGGVGVAASVSRHRRPG
jgi:alpha-1,6-mannosyltransferase